MKVLNNEVGSTGFGLMSFGFLPQENIESLAFPTMKKSIELGATFWNGGEFYGKINGSNSLTLCNAYFSKYPEDAAKVTLSIKVCLNPAGGIDCSPAGMRACYERCTAQLPPSVKKIDIFQAASVDPKVPIEETVGALAEMVREGKIGGIGISEVSAKSVRRAAAVHEIAACEIELSMFETRNIDNGVMAACAELDIPVIAYSPLGVGFLAGRFKSPEDMPAGDPRRGFPRFSPENFQKNIDLVEKIRGLAERKGVTTGQLALAWVRGFAGQTGMPRVVLPLPGASSAERVAENSAQGIDMTEQEHREVDPLLKELVAVGHRYPEAVRKLCEG